MKIFKNIRENREKLTQIRNIVKSFFDTPAKESLLTDNSDMYIVLGEIKEILEID